jgi:putative IMPACT (imprinted ancient) family translation regulator
LLLFVTNFVPVAKRHGVFGIHVEVTAYKGWCALGTGGVSVGKSARIATACSGGAAVISGDAIKHQACECELASADP